MQKSFMTILAALNNGTVFHYMGKERPVFFFFFFFFFVFFFFFFFYFFFCLFFFFFFLFFFFFFFFFSLHSRHSTSQSNRS
jgi:hypothetical protein